MKNRPAAIAFIFVTVMLDMLALGLIAPVLPKLILDFLGGDMKDAANWNGWFGLVFAAMQFFFAPLIGVLSDRFGRRPVILLSNLGLGLDHIVLARSSCCARIPGCGSSPRCNFSLMCRTRSSRSGRCMRFTAMPGTKPTSGFRLPSWASARLRFLAD